jgi:hypothetical protein
MFRRLILALGLALALHSTFVATEARAQDPQRAFSRTWGSQYARTDWERFYHYPYVYYPQNFWGNEYYRSSEDLYFRYPPEMRVPVYNKQWHNYYPEAANWDRYIGGHFQHVGPPTGGRYHMGHHFILDTF